MSKQIQLQKKFWIGTDNKAWSVKLQPEANCFTSYNRRKGLCSVFLCAIALRSSPPSHVSNSNGQQSSQLFCVHCMWRCEKWSAGQFWMSHSELCHFNFIRLHQSLFSTGLRFVLFRVRFRFWNECHLYFCIFCCYEYSHMYAIC
jgi:hypothetical protein